MQIHFSKTPRADTYLSHHLADDGLLAGAAAALLRGIDTLATHVCLEVAKHRVQLVLLDVGDRLGGRLVALVLRLIVVGRAGLRYLDPRLVVALARWQGTAGFRAYGLDRPGVRRRRGRRVCGRLMVLLVGGAAAGGVTLVVAAVYLRQQ